MKQDVYTIPMHHLSDLDGTYGDQSFETAPSGLFCAEVLRPASKWSGKTTQPTMRPHRRHQAPPYRPSSQMSAKALGYPVQSTPSPPNAVVPEPGAQPRSLVSHAPPKLAKCLRKSQKSTRIPRDLREFARPPGKRMDPGAEYRSTRKRRLDCVYAQRNVPRRRAASSFAPR